MRTIYVIYRRPTDYPKSKYVMREHALDKGKVTPTEHFYVSETLKELRDKLPEGAIRWPRSEMDEPQIVEWWW